MAVVRQALSHLLSHGKGYDLILQAFTGMVPIMGEPGSGPCARPTPVDQGIGMHALSATCSTAAQAKHWRSCRIGVSLLRTASLSWAKDAVVLGKARSPNVLMRARIAVPISELHTQTSPSSLSESRANRCGNAIMLASGPILDYESPNYGKLQSIGQPVVQPASGPTLEALPQACTAHRGNSS